MLSFQVCFFFVCSPIHYGNPVSGNLLMLFYCMDFRWPFIASLSLYPCIHSIQSLNRRTKEQKCVTYVSGGESGPWGVMGEFAERTGRRGQRGL